MSRFRVGDVCEIVGGPHWKATSPFRILIGTECTIVSHREQWDGVSSYQAACRDGLEHWITERSLRLRRPPSWNEWLYDTKDVERENSNRNQALASCTDAGSNPEAGGQAEYPAALTGGAPCR